MAEFGISFESSFEDKLTIAITSIPPSHIINALPWIGDPNVVILRFEEIVGPSGGGKLKIQQKAIVKLANALGLVVTTPKLKEITDNLFGTNAGPPLPSTFHSGQIGSWKHCYTDEHKRLFNEIWGNAQIALGYPLAE